MELVAIPGGTYQIGTNEADGYPQDREQPVTTVTVDPFYVAPTTVTNSQFAAFVEATGYQTDSEKYGWSYVFTGFLTDEQKQEAQAVPGLPWWFAVRGADWQHPTGPDSSIEALMNHPVVQVSRNDAVAYCQWVGGRLPSEAEWEVAAKGGTDNRRWPWGDEALAPDGEAHCNTWTGTFPTDNDEKDGYLGTAPVRTYAPNGYGLYQMIGNVWEWCANPRYVPLADFQVTSGKQYWQAHQAVDDEAYAMRGGSFLCHESYCKRYRIAARNGNTGASAASNLGFRVFADQPTVKQEAPACCGALSRQLMADKMGKE